MTICKAKRDVEYLSKYLEKAQTRRAETKIWPPSRVGLAQGGRGRGTITPSSEKDGFMCVG